MTSSRARARAATPETARREVPSESTRDVGRHITPRFVVVDETPRARQARTTARDTRAHHGASTAPVDRASTASVLVVVRRHDSSSVDDEDF